MKVSLRGGRRAPLSLRGAPTKQSRQGERIAPLTSAVAAGLTWMLLAGELSDDYRAPGAATTALPPDPLDFVQSLGGQVAFTAIRATGDGNVLNYQ